MSQLSQQEQNNKTYLNIGSGNKKLDGFVNIDIEAGADIVHDVTKGLPFAANSVDGVYSEHFIEHISQVQVVNFMRECRRVLKPGGTLRLATPDLDYIVKRYLKEDWREGSEMIERLGWNWVANPCEQLNLTMRSWGHQWLFNEAEMRRLAEIAGLQFGERCEWGQSTDPLLAGLEYRKGSRLICEFSKKVQQPADNPLVSILMTAYKPQFFAAALNSAIHQSWQNLQIVVCDDSEGSEIEAIVNKLDDARIIYKKNPQRLGGRKNYLQAFDLSSGAYIKFLNDDDLLHPQCVERMVTVLQSENEVTLVTSHRQTIDEFDQALPDMHHNTPPVEVDSRIEGTSAVEVLLRHCVNFIGEPTTTLFRRADLAGTEPNIFSFGGRAALRNGDVTMWVNLLSKGDLAYLTDTLSYFRMHPAQRQTEADYLSEADNAWRQIQFDAQRMGLLGQKSSDQLISSPLANYQSGETLDAPIPALRILDKHERQLSDAQHAELQKAMEMHQDGNADKAHQVFGRILREAPGHPDAILGLALTSKVLIGMHAGLSYLRLLTEKYPDYAAGHNEMGRVLLEEKEVKHALISFRNAIEADAAYLPARKSLTGLLISSGNINAALNNLRQTTAAFPEDAETLVSLVQTCIEAGKTSEAEDHLQSLKQLDPQNQQLPRLQLIVHGANAAATPEEGEQESDVTVEAAGQELVSIIIPVYNNLQFTHKCLAAVFQNTAYTNYEVIVIDNASTDDTAVYLENLNDDRVRVITNEDNQGFVGACRQGVEAADGSYLLFLNNDTEVQPNWMSALVKTFERYPDCGAAGAKLVYPNGHLQEAGAIIFKDGFGWNFGRGLSPNDPRFNFVREVDYCSGAALMVSKTAWDTTGGFDERYAPAYYEDTDLCFALRKASYKVYYQPQSVVVHHEGMTAGTSLDSGFKAYQEVNRNKFVEKWRTVLGSQYANDPANVSKAANRNKDKSVLIIDRNLPFYDRASGARRLLEIIKILLDNRFQVSLLSASPNLESQYRPHLEFMGVEVFAGFREAVRKAGIEMVNDDPLPFYQQVLRERCFDYALIEFWDTAEFFMPLLRKHSPNTEVVIDTIDLHFVRELREAEINQDAVMKELALVTRASELDIYARADRLWVVTKDEKTLLEESIKQIPIDVVPNIHDAKETHADFAETRDLLFVGNFNHTPNCDALEWFCEEIFPRVKLKMPEIKLQVVGNRADIAAGHFASADIDVKGYVPSLEEYLKGSRISVNPLRFGAGMKGKIGQALAHGLPVVTTSIGAEGMSLQHEQHAMIANDSEQFAAAILSLYADQDLWEKLARNGQAHVKANWSSERIGSELQTIFKWENREDDAPKVSIVMLTYNALEYTRKCVQSIQENTRIPYEIVFVDNNSDADTREYLQEIVAANDHFKLIQNEENRGFAAGNNQGVKAARGELVLLLNNDVLVFGQWLEQLVAALSMDSRIGAVGPITNYISGRQMIANVPYQGDDCQAFALEVQRRNAGVVTPRRRIAGFAMLMRRSLYLELGGFDEDFGIGNFEDDDLCLRIRQKGLAIMVDEGTFIHHYGSQSFKANGIDYQASIDEGQATFFRKWPNLDYDALIERTDVLVDEHNQLLEQATEYIVDAKYIEAQDLFDKVLLENPISVDALYGRAVASRFLGDSVTSLKYLQDVIRVDPGCAVAYNEIGSIMMEDGDPQSAQQLFARAVKEEAGLLSAQRNYGDALIQSEDYENGIRAFMQILDNHPEDIESMMYLAQINAEAGKYRESLGYVDRILEIEPQFEPAQSLLSIIEAEVDNG